MAERKRPGPKPGCLASIEGGRRGGAKVKALYGLDYYCDIGRLGGQATRDRHGTEFFVEAGRRGGAASAQRRRGERT